MGAFDKAKDKAQQLIGKAKEELGDKTDNESLENEGRADQLKGKAKEEWHDLREEGQDTLRGAKDRLTGEEDRGKDGR